MVRTLRIPPVDINSLTIQHGSLDVLSVLGAVIDRDAAVGSLLAAHVHAENSGGVHIS